MPCTFDIKPEDRHCKYCTVTNCDSREPKTPETHATTQAWFVKQTEDGNSTTTVDMERV